MKKILAAALLVTFALTGCNTIKGVGKDVSKAGQAVTGTAKKHLMKFVAISFIVTHFHRLI